jgi:hypothetical protein
MDELKKKVSAESKALISKICMALEDAKSKNIYLDEGKLLMAVAEHYNNLDNAFFDYKERASSSKKGGWFK